MNPEMLPEGVIARFRTLSLERISRVESTWNALTQGVHEEAAIREMARDLHTLKGDARIVGFEEVGLLAQKLEELLLLAGQLRYQVSEDLELVVTMATQFVGMLLRKKAGSTMGGIDLDGFVRQVDEILRETRTLPTTPRLVALRSQAKAAAAIDRLSEATRQRFAIAATTTYLEYLSARGGTSRTRLRGVWDTLRQELATIHVVALAPILDRHTNAVRELATELGKHVRLELELDDLQGDSQVAEALDMAVVHLVRNAIDHGIEAPEARASAGKPALGTVRVRGCERGGVIELTVSDDGKGIDLAAVRARAIEHELLAPAAAAAASPRELFELLFHPGFTTRTEVSQISGRGVGMDAVRAGIARAGGTVQIESVAGAGSTVRIAVPVPQRQIHAYQFLAPGGAIALAVSARWSPTIEPALLAQAIDPVAAIQLGLGSRQTSVGLSKPADDLALRLRWGFLEVALLAGSEPVLVTGERICPTSDDYPIEVISVDGQETLLLRPELVANLGGRSATG